MEPGTADHVAVPVAALDAAVTWFRSRFDVVESARGGWAEHAFVRLAAADAPSAGTELELVRSDQGDRGGAGLPGPELSMRVPDVAQVAERLADRGTGVETVADPDGVAGCRVTGPDGVRLRLVERSAGPDWGIDRVTLTHPTPSTATERYADILGWTVEEAGDAQSVVRPPAAAPGTTGVAFRAGDPPTRDPDPWTDGHVAVACDHLEVFVETLGERGLQGAAIRVSCGGTRGVIRAAPGLPIELVERPADP